jgi:large subunit ribosomal protein L21
MIIDDGQAIIGTPLVEGAKVMATVVDQIKGPKLIVFKYKPKQRYRIKTGHRQKYVRLQVNEILVAN